MKYNIDFAKINEIKNDFDQIIKEMQSEIDIMNNLLEKTSWNGPARNAFEDNYNKKMQVISTIPGNLQLYVKFMELVIENYGDGFEQIEKSFQELLDEQEKNKNIQNSDRGIVWNRR